MNLFEFFQLGAASLDFFIQSSILPGGSGGCGDWILFGSAFNAITAAWATLGYYAQADVLYYINAGWQKFAILLYVGAGIAVIASIAFGQTPKMWVWFLIGPAVFYWLIDTRQPADGVAWMVGAYMQDQNEVWKQAEAGAVNSGIVRRGNLSFNATGPSVPVEVSTPFLMLDSIVSDTVRQLSSWTGALSQVNPYENMAPSSTETSVALESDAPGYYFGEELSSEEQCGADKVHFSAVADKKWQYLNSVTQAELTNTDARDAFARFMASECGGNLSSVIDFTKYAKALNFKDRDLPDSAIFRGNFNSPLSSVESEYVQLRLELGKQQVPTPLTLKRLLDQSIQQTQSSEGSSFLRSVEWDPTTASTGTCGDTQDAQVIKSVLSRDLITCDAYLYMLLLYFRYEAALIFSQTFQSSGPSGWFPHDLTYNMLYGWDIPYDEPTSNGPALPCPAGNGMSIQSQYQFVYNLILAHLFRNELNRLPELVTVGKDKTQAIMDDSQLYNATIGSTSKAAEVYTWSLMIPYVQGILLYLLSMAFPIVCMLMLVPSWMKIIVTWASFFVWVKLWDLGFAFVATLERTLWAQMANSNASREVNRRILEMSDYGGFTTTDCKYNGDQLYPYPDPGCTETPIVYLTEAPGWCGTEPLDCLNIFAQDVNSGNGFASGAFDASVRIFDLALVAGAALDFDLANGYYIYIMSALYFAVPAVTGQMVLGAKSGMAGMVDKIAGDPAGKAGNAAGQSFSGNETARVKQNAATVSQESKAKGYRESGLVDKALGQQNLAAEEGRLAGHLGQVAEGSSRRAQALSSGNEYRRARQNVGQEILKGALSLDYGRFGGRIQNNSSQMVTGSAPSASGGPAGGAGDPSQGPGNEGSGKSGDAPPKGPLTRNWQGAATGYLNAMQAGFISDLTLENTKASNQAAALGGAAGIQGYAAQQRSAGFRSASERTMAQAEFQAATSQYDAMNNYSNQRAGRMAVLGVPPGMIGPERRPEDAMGMAMAGMLDAPGRATRQTANFFDPQSGNGFFSRVAGSQSALQQQYGYAATRQPYVDRVEKAGFLDEGFTSQAGVIVTGWGNGDVENIVKGANTFADARVAAKEKGKPAGEEE